VQGLEDLLDLVGSHELSGKGGEALGQLVSLVLGPDRRTARVVLNSDTLGHFHRPLRGYWKNRHPSTIYETAHPCKKFPRSPDATRRRDTRGHVAEPPMAMEETPDRSRSIPQSASGRGLPLRGRSCKLAAGLRYFRGMRRTLR